MAEPTLPARGVTAMEEDLRAVDQALRQALIEVIERHLCGSSRAIEEEVNGLSIVRIPSHDWATQLIAADRDASESFGASNDVVLLEQIERTCEELRRLLSALSVPTRRMIEFRKISLLEPTGTALLVAAKSVLAALIKVVGQVRKDPTYRKLAGKKRNWRAASVASECRRIWAQYHWPGPSPLQLSAEELEQYRTHLADSAARHEKHDEPGHFGKFLTDVNQALGILSKNGEPVSAATALDSWRSAEEASRPISQEKRRRKTVAPDAKGS